MPSKKKILITSGFWQGAISCIQSLGRAGYETYLLENSLYASAGHSRYCTKQIVSPPEQESENYLKFLLHSIQRKDYDLFIPVSDQVVDMASSCQDEIRKHTHLFLSEQATVDLVRNKKAWYRFALKKNILIPPTFFPENMEDIEKLVGGRVSFPCFIKLSLSTSSAGVFPAKDKAFLFDYYRRLNSEDDWPVIQQKIDGNIYGVTAVCDRGKIKLHFSFYADYIYSHGGTPPIAYSFNDEKLLEEAARVVELINWTGAIDFDYIRDADGKYFLLELNPRFSGTVNFAYKLGLDMPLAYTQVALKEKFTVQQISYKDKVSYRTILPQEIMFGYKHKEYRTRILLNWLKWGSKTNIFWDDWPLLRAQMKETRWQCANLN